MIFNEKRLACKSLRLRNSNREVNVHKLEVCIRGVDGWARNSLFSVSLTGLCLYILRHNAVGCQELCEIIG